MFISCLVPSFLLYILVYNLITISYTSLGPSNEPSKSRKSKGGGVRDTIRYLHIFIKFVQTNLIYLL